jgi:DNA-directed RNA polymerase subunit RPC12/RpoP
MLVRKLKCPACGANKVNDISTSYIYCDYCGTLMGYDIEMLQDESKEIFSVHNLAKPLQQKYIRLTQELNQAIQSKNRESYIDIQMQIYETEFELYKKRFSPKIKQPAYRQKYLTYYHKFWNEKIDNGYFEKAQKAQEDFKQYASKIITHTQGSKVITVFDDNFVEYLNVVKEYVKKSIEETINMDCMKYYPEGGTGVSTDILYKQSISAMIQQFNEATMKKSLTHLELENEYIEIEDIELTSTNCMVCNSVIKIPEAAESVVCETCGSFNELTNNKIKCFNCGGSFHPKENDACPYCKAKIMKIKDKKPTTPESTSSGFNFIDFLKNLFKGK